jgi:hypothetical protein
MAQKAAKNEGFGAFLAGTTGHGRPASDPY